jgi:hypothetical protein
MPQILAGAAGAAGERTGRRVALGVCGGGHPLYRKFHLRRRRRRRLRAATGRGRLERVRVARVALEARGLGGDEARACCRARCCAFHGEACGLR